MGLPEGSTLNILWRVQWRCQHAFRGHQDEIKVVSLKHLAVTCVGAGETETVVMDNVLPSWPLPHPGTPRLTALLASGPRSRWP